MTMEMIARQLDISTSTVSRAIRGKYIRYRRLVLIRDLFSGSASESTDASPDNVCRRISELVRSEDRSKPLSDDKIAGILKEEGLSISRRTVAKYRQRMGIPESRIRSYL